jgi:hypothetical protein
MRKLDRLGWVDQYSFRIGGELFGVRTTSSAFGCWIRDSFSSYIVDDESDAYLSVVVDEESARSSIRKKSMLYRASTPIVSTLHTPTVAQAFICQLEFFVMAEREALMATVAPALVGETRVLIPTMWTWGLAALGAKMRRAGVTLPAAHAVWIDESGRMLPSMGLLDIPHDALQRLGDYVPSNGGLERLIITEPTTVDATLVRSPDAKWSTPDLMHAVSRAGAVYSLASEIVETNDVEWQSALESLARLVGGSRCYAINSWHPDDVLAAITQAAVA